MTKPQITIHIGGPAGAGKTTLAHYLTLHLRNLHGVKVTLKDGEHVEPWPSMVELPEYFDADVTIHVEQK
jgi:uridine kinase